MILSQAQKKRAKCDKITPLMQRIGAWFQRKPTTKWSVYESKALKELNPIPEDDLASLEDYYLNFGIVNGFDPRRRDLCTLLNNWMGELDRAHLWAQKEKSVTVKGSASQPEKQPSMFDLRQRMELLNTEISKHAERLTELDKAIAITHEPAGLKREHAALKAEWHDLCEKRRNVKAKMLSTSDKF